MESMKDVLAIALRLDVQDRAAPAERLLVSLDDLGEQEAERVWSEEAQRRRDAYHAGQAKAIDADAVHERAEKFLR